MNALFELFGEHVLLPRSIFTDLSGEKPRRLSFDQVSENLDEYLSKLQNESSDDTWYRKEGQRIFMIPEVSKLWERIDKEILWAEISYAPEYFSDEEFILHSKRTKEDIVHFISFLHGIEYNPGYGTQHLYGTVVYKDGSWKERGEYDGSEWWEHRSIPEEPETKEE